MANIDDIKKMAKDAFDTLADVSVEAYKLAEEKARVFARKAKLNAGIANDRAIIRRIKTEIGGTYYKFYKDAPVEELKQLCDDITAALDRIADRQRELEELKNCEPCEDEEECCCDFESGGAPEADSCCAPEPEAESCCAPEPESESCCAPEPESDSCCTPEPEAESCCTPEGEPCCDHETDAEKQED